MKTALYALLFVLAVSASPAHGEKWVRVGNTNTFEVANEARSVRCTVEVLPLSSIFEEEALYVRLIVAAFWQQSLNDSGVEMSLSTMIDLRGEEHDILRVRDYLSAEHTVDSKRFIALVDRTTTFGRINMNIGRTITSSCVSGILLGPDNALPGIHIKTIKSVFEVKDSPNVAVEYPNSRR